MPTNTCIGRTERKLNASRSAAESTKNQGDIEEDAEETLVSSPIIDRCSTPSDRQTPASPRPSNRTRIMVAARTGQNLLLAAVFALFAFVPFEVVAKVTLVGSATLFILDPIPPYTRLLAVGSTLMVYILTKLEKHWREQQQLLEEDEREQDTLSNTVDETKKDN